jgi:hypothetical protein
MDSGRRTFTVGPTQAILSGVITIFFYALMIAAVWKIFQVATELGEIKNLLSDIRRNTEVQRPPAPVSAVPISLESAEALLREIGEESHR